jgi:GT2 family glycosyltransferase
MPTISIILTSFNHERFIRDAINSVINQTYSDWELIIWDDASTDSSHKIISEYTDPRIKLYINERNIRSAHGVNKGIFEVATGKYIAMHHSDDIWDVNKLQMQFDFLESHQQIGAVFTWAKAIDETGNNLSNKNHFYSKIFSQKNRNRYEWLRYFLLEGNALCHPSILIRKDCYVNLGSYSDTLAQVPDLDMWIRLCSKYEIHVLNKPLVSFRVRDNEANTSGSRPETIIRGAYENFLLLENYLMPAVLSDIFEILPEANVYNFGQDSIKEYALARALLSNRPSSSVALFSLNIIYALLSNERTKELLSSKYAFNYSDFIDLTAQHDVFNIESLNSLNKKHSNAVLELNSLHLKEAVQLKQENQAIKKTISWRITAPLRLILLISKGDKPNSINVLKELCRPIWLAFPFKARKRVRDSINSMRNWRSIFNSRANHLAIKAIVDRRNAYTYRQLTQAPQKSSATTKVLPEIDICVVTYNSAKWVEKFVKSLIALDYPKQLLHIRFVDNSSTDSQTINSLTEACKLLNSLGVTAEITLRPNLGFGRGNNTAIQQGTSPFCLITNIDLEFETSSLACVATMAVDDDPSIAAWEFRQKPYEHPKFYDPVTLLTNWNSHACVLIRRTSLEKVGGYDANLFMYCEDVELSYRLRRAGYLLRYCPKAVVQHHTYETNSIVKPLQYTGSTLGNFYLRMKYGNFIDMIGGVVLLIGLIFQKSAFPGAKKAIVQNIFKAAAIAPKAIAGRQKSTASFPFRGFDYELTREGAFFPSTTYKTNHPLVSVITRTYKGRNAYLLQALKSVANQTYLAIEHIVVEDGGNTMRHLIESFAPSTNICLKFIEAPKLGRSNTGNEGLKAAQGEYCIFLDDDDLLFSEHIETLVNALTASSDAVAAYSTAMEVVTSKKDSLDNIYIEESWNTHPLPDTRFSYDALLKRNLMAIQSILFKRTLYEERGGFETDLDALEDWNLWIRYAWKNNFIYVPKLTSLYRTPAAVDAIMSRQRAFAVVSLEARQRAEIRNL